jgi:probable blue pigment (indigoidine) exporter
VRPWRMLFVIVGWGSCYVLILWGMRDASVLWFAALRALVAGLFLLGALLLSSRRGDATVFPRRGGTWGLIGALALTNVALTFGAMFAGASGLTAGAAAVLSNSAPLLVVLPAWWLYAERPRAVEIAGVALGFGGLVLVAAPTGFGRGAGLAVLAAVGITAGALLARRLTDVDLLALGMWQFLLGGTALSVVAAVTEGPPTTITWSARFLTVLLVLAAGATALPYVLWFGELRRASLTSVTAWTLLVPVVGVAFGVALLGERVTLMEWLGDAIVIAALLLVIQSSRAAHRPRARKA